MLPNERPVADKLKFALRKFKQGYSSLAYNHLVELVYWYIYWSIVLLFNSENEEILSIMTGGLSDAEVRAINLIEVINAICALSYMQIPMHLPYSYVCRLQLVMCWLTHWLVLSSISTLQILLEDARDEGLDISEPPPESKRWYVLNVFFQTCFITACQKNAF